MVNQKHQEHYRRTKLRERVSTSNLHEKENNFNNNTARKTRKLRNKLRTTNIISLINLRLKQKMLPREETLGGTIEKYKPSTTCERNQQ